MLSRTTKILLEILSVYILFIGILWSTRILPSSFTKWQQATFEGSILTIFIGMILLPIGAMWITKSSGETSTFDRESLEEAFRTGSQAMGVMLPVTGLSFPVAGMMGYNFTDWGGALIIGFWYLLSIPALCFVFKKKQQQGNQLISSGNFLSIPILFTISIGLVYGLTFLHPKAARVFIALVFIGMAEEFLYRGYIQTRLNQAFKKSFVLFNFSFGYGIIITSLLFGLMHVLSPGNPWHWVWGLWTFFGGFAFGVIREKGGSFIASGLVHGVIMIFPVFFS